MKSKYCEILFLTLASWEFSELGLFRQRLVGGYMACNMKQGIPVKIGKGFCMFYLGLRFTGEHK